MKILTRRACAQRHLPPNALPGETRACHPLGSHRRRVRGGASHALLPIWKRPWEAVAPLDKASRNDLGNKSPHPCDIGAPARTILLGLRSRAPRRRSVSPRWMCSNFHYQRMPR